MFINYSLSDVLNPKAQVLMNAAPNLQPLPDNVKNASDITIYIIFGFIALVYVAFLFIRKNSKKTGYRIDRERKFGSKNKFLRKSKKQIGNYKIENVDDEVLDNIIKFDFDRMTESWVQQTINLMNQELEKNLEQYKDDDTYMLPEEKAKQILEQMINIAVAQRNSMIEQFVESSDTGKIFDFFDSFVSEINEYELDARFKYRSMRHSLRELDSEEAKLREKEANLKRESKQGTVPSKETKEEIEKEYRQDEEDFEKDVLKSQKKEED